MAAERCLTEAQALDVVLEATRALLWIATPADAKRIATGVVEAFGGTVVGAREADADALPVDISFGDGAPLLPSAPAGGTRLLLERHLPMLVADVSRAVELGSQADRLAEDASIDPLTRLSNRRMLGRALGRLRAGDTVVMVDLDHFKRINDTLGHDAGDRVLSALGRTLRSTVRGGELAGRYGGEEFVVILAGATAAFAFLERLRAVWERERPYPVTFSAGTALVGEDVTLALRAADRAMYRAKEAGRDRWEAAVAADYTGDEPATAGAPAPGPAPGTFVAFSRLEVPDGGGEAVEAAFRDRLGAVDAWEGFRSLEVWAELDDDSAYVMVSWWDTAEEFTAYMRSDDHRASHRRIASGDDRPRPRQFQRYRIVAR